LSHQKNQKASSSAGEGERERLHLRVDAIDAPIALDGPVVLDDVNQSADGVQVLHTAVSPRRIRPIEDVQSIRIAAISSTIGQRIRKGHETGRDRVKAAGRARVVRLGLVESLVRVRKMLLTLAESATSNFR